MTRHHILKSPRINPLNTLIKPRPIRTTYRVPQQSLLPKCLAPRILQRGKNPRRPPRRRIDSRLRVLLSSRQAEQKIRLDQGFRRLVEEDQLLVRMCVHELVFKLLVEFSSNLNAFFPFGREDG